MRLVVGKFALLAGGLYLAVCLIFFSVTAFGVCGARAGVLFASFGEFGGQKTATKIVFLAVEGCIQVSLLGCCKRAKHKFAQFCFFIGFSPKFVSVLQKTFYFCIFQPNPENFQMFPFLGLA